MHSITERQILGTKKEREKDKYVPMNIAEDKYILGKILRTIYNKNI